MTMPERGGASAGRRAEALRLLRDANGPMSITELAEALGVHPNTVRFHLDTLETRGQVERVTGTRRTPGRPPQLFQPVAGMDPDGPRNYRLLAELLVEAIGDGPDAHTRAVRAGRAWGREHAAAQAERAAGGEPVTRLSGMLDEFGFAPEQTADPAGGPARIGLRNCPFLELAERLPHVTCPIHLGLMRGALDAWDSAVTVERLDAFAEPGLCVAHLNADGGA